MPDDGQRHCKRCVRDLPLTCFGKDRSRADGLSFYCKECVNSRHRASRAENSEAVNAAARERRARTKAAVKERNRRYYLANREKLKADAAAYRRAHPERVAAANAAKVAAYAQDPQKFRDAAAASRRRHHEKAKERDRRYRQSHHAAACLRQREWYQKNRESLLVYQKQWRRANVDKRRRYNAARRARLRGAEHEVVDYRKVYERDGGVCHLCGLPVTFAEMHGDHVIPLSRGGSHTYGNVKTAHSVCNLRKNSKLVEEIRGAAPAVEP